MRSIHCVMRPGRRSRGKQGVSLSRAVGMDFSPHEFAERFLGFGDKEIVENLWKDQGRRPTEAEFAHLAARKWFYIERAIQAGEVRPYAATINLLRQAAASYPMAIC